jgi:hypothetical protein
VPWGGGGGCEIKFKKPLFQENPRKMYTNYLL